MSVFRVGVREKWEGRDGGDGGGGGDEYWTLNKEKEETGVGWRRMVRNGGGEEIGVTK